MSDLVYGLKEYLSPELIFMIPVLIVFGNMLKKSKRVSNTLIPTILSLVGIPLALITSLASKYEPMTNVQIIVWILMGVGQGVFLGAASVGVHQFFKQHEESKKLKMWEYEKEKQEKEEQLVALAMEKLREEELRKQAECEDI